MDKKISELPVLTDIRGARYPVEKSGLNYKVSPFSNYLFTTSGTANNYTLTVDGVSAYFNGLMIVTQFNVNNTGPSVININGLGSKSIVKEGSTPVSAGDLPANKATILIYDGTNFQLIVGNNAIGIFATETVAGVVEKATDDEMVSRAETGGTGAFLVATPKQVYEQVLRYTYISD